MTPGQSAALGKAIRLRREEAAWTQEDLAAKSGVSVRTLQRAEKGVGLAKENIRALAEAFGIPAAKLLGSGASRKKPVPCRLLAGPGEGLRRHGFTRWMSRDLLQASTDFMKNIGLAALYAESSSEKLYRYLFWSPPPGCPLEIRSGRPYGVFAEFDRINCERAWPLLSLHVSELDLYSGVWVGQAHYAEAAQTLAAYGITPASRR